MVAPSTGAVVLVPFPFSDLSSSKLRPAVVLADAARGDWILCQVTSNPYADTRAIELHASDFAQGSLHRASFARPVGLFTAQQRLIVAKVAQLTDAAFTRLIDGVIKVFRP
jgi:mRNA interferase MazF